MDEASFGPDDDRGSAPPTRRRVIAVGATATAAAWVTPQVLSLSSAAAASGEALYRAQFDMTVIPDPIAGDDIGRETPDNVGTCTPANWTTATDLDPFDCIQFNVVRIGSVITLTLNAAGVTKGLGFTDNLTAFTGPCDGCIVTPASGSTASVDLGTCGDGTNEADLGSLRVTLTGPSALSCP